MQVGIRTRLRMGLDLRGQIAIILCDTVSSTSSSITLSGRRKLAAARNLP
jgi:hypothetical protein